MTSDFGHWTSDAPQGPFQYPEGFWPDGDARSSGRAVVQSSGRWPLPSRRVFAGLVIKRRGGENGGPAKRKGGGERKEGLRITHDVSRILAKGASLTARRGAYSNANARLPTFQYPEGFWPDGDPVVRLYAAVLTPMPKIERFSTPKGFGPMVTTI